MKIEAALILNNSPYAEVRAVVSNKDDVNVPASTIRAWTLGIFFSAAISAVNQLFEIRYPAIYVDNNVAQLLAYPLGIAWAKWLPNLTFSLFGHQFELNPGPFNKKEHMVITIMASIAKSVPYTQYIIFTQAMPFYFNQQYSRQFSYQILIALSTNFIGYGLAGLTRRFLVYPAYTVWPKSLVTIALNSALHNERNYAVPGPLKRMYNMSRYKFFMIAFAAMFVWNWFPSFIIDAFSNFDWMAWIAPTNRNLVMWTGAAGLSLFNFMPTFDWNIVTFQHDPLMVPAFATFNLVAGGAVGMLMTAGVWYTNTWNTGYLAPVQNKLWDHNGKRYNVTRIIDDKGYFDINKYMSYSAAYLGASNALVYGCFFAAYSAVVTYVIIFHNQEFIMGAKSLWATISKKIGRKNKSETEDDSDGLAYEDVHMRLMRPYREVSEWWYFAVLIGSAALGFAGIASSPTYTTLAVIPYGAIMCLVMVIPVGLVYAMTGIEITLNVLAEFIGGIWVSGNALAMNFFKTFGYVTCAHALHFSNDMKLAHYTKIPPWTTFIAQMLATFISTFITTGVMRWQLDIKDVCTSDAPFRFSCPGITTFFTASVLWGTIGPDKVFGHNGQYKLLLIGFPAGVAIVLVFWGFIKYFPRNRYIRQIHPVVFATGPLNMGPYNFRFMWPAVPVAWLSWIYVRNRFLAFWSKYNFVLSAAFSAGIAISAIIIFFGVALPEKSLEWWGNEVNSNGCAGNWALCAPYVLAKGERFYPWWDGSNGVPAPGLPTA
jgi:OPT family small oligopeptide transporter